MLRYRQYEHALPMLVARELIRRGAGQEGILEFHTLWFPDTTESTQLEAVMHLKQEKVIETSDIIERKEDDAGRKYQLKTEPPVPRQELVFRLQMQPDLERYYRTKEGYESLVQEEEMGIKKMAEELQSFLEEQSLVLGKTELTIMDEDMAEQLNPYLAASYLEMRGCLEIVKMLPPAPYAKNPNKILQIDLKRPVEIIKTSRMEYNMKTGELILSDRTNHELSDTSQPCKILRAMCQAEGYFLSHEELVKVSGRRVPGEPDKTVSKNLIDELKRALGIQAKEKAANIDIIENVRLEGYRLIK